MPSRGLFGYRNQFLTDTHGEGIMNTIFDGYEAWCGDIQTRSTGSLISFETGDAVTYGLFNAQQRGTLIVNAGEKVYAGEVVGYTPTGEDITVNVCKTKHLTNTRASGSDDALRLVPVRKLSLEGCLEFLAPDELLEVTPENLRIRKRILDHDLRMKATGVLLLLNPTSEFKGGKIEKGGMMKRYINLLLPQKKLFFYAILSSIITTILGIASSMFNKILMDEVLPYGLNSLLVTLILVFSVVSITSTLIGFVRQWVLIHLSIKIDIPLMLGYFGHIFNLPMKFFATRKTGDITTRYSDANTIKSIFTSIALSLVMDISMAVITGIILFRMNAMLFSISLFMALVSILLVLVYKQPYKKINEESMAQSAALNSQMIESLRGIETVKCNANEQTELDNLEREYMKSLKISLRSSRISTTQGLISSFISTGFSMLTTYVGITQVLNGEMTLGGFMAFSTLSGYFTSP